ncbi:MAG: GGDEF domain-containing response regulator [Pseudomonadota bacterium]
MNNAETVLLLEDDDFDAAVTRELLEKCCRRAFTVKRCKFLSEAQTQLSRAEYLVALIDMNVPDSSGLDTVRTILQSNPATPVVVLTGTDDTDVAVTALGLGVQDYLPKSSLDSRSLERVIQYSIRRKAKENDLTAKAYYDALTGLGNRALLYDRWRRSLARSKRAHCNIGALVVDVDKFKEVNDNFGHDAGDHLLMHLSARLKSSVRDTDIVARLGGDEFVLILESIKDKSEVDAVRDKLMGEVSCCTAPSGKEIPYTISIGGAVGDPQTHEDLMEVLRCADAEMYEFKAKTRGGAVMGGTDGLYDRRHGDTVEAPRRTLSA